MPIPDDSQSGKKHSQNIHRKVELAKAKKAFVTQSMKISCYRKRYCTFFRVTFFCLLVSMIKNSEIPVTRKYCATDIYKKGHVTLL